MMEAAMTSETLVNFYRSARRDNPEDSHLNIILSATPVPSKWSVPSGFSPKVVCMHFSSPPVRDTYPVQLIRLDLITVIIGEEQKL
jgi:hypothetical protein